MCATGSPVRTIRTVDSTLVERATMPRSLKGMPVNPLARGMFPPGPHAAEFGARQSTPASGGCQGTFLLGSFSGSAKYRLEHPQIVLVINASQVGFAEPSST